MLARWSAYDTTAAYRFRGRGRSHNV